MVSENPKTSVYDEERLLRRIDELGERAERLEKELARSHRLVMLGTLVGTIAHEFNNLLTPVMSYAQLALHDMDDKDLVSKALEKSLNTTDKAANIASALLGFTREGSDDSSCSVQSVLDEALTCMARTPEKDGISCTYEIEDGLRAGIQPIALQHVFLNLLLNACKAMRPKAGSLVIRGERSTWNPPTTTPTRNPQHDQIKSSGGVAILVSDTGHGISQDIQNKVFEPFFSGVDENETPEGSGLGLTICKRLIEEVGGTISVQSTPGEGTTFSIMLPDGEAAAEHGDDSASDRSAA